MTETHKEIEMNLQNCISVIVPVYNMEQYLPKYIDSMMARSFELYSFLVRVWQLKIHLTERKQS